MIARMRASSPANPTLVCREPPGSLSLGLWKVAGEGLKWWSDGNKWWSWWHHQNVPRERERESDNETGASTRARTSGGSARARAECESDLQARVGRRCKSVKKNAGARTSVSATSVDADDVVELLLDCCCGGRQKCRCAGASVVGVVAGAAPAVLTGTRGLTSLMLH